MPYIAMITEVKKHSYILPLDANQLQNVIVLPWPMLHPFTKIQKNQAISFSVALLTKNKQTNQSKDIKYYRGKRGKCHSLVDHFTNH